MPTRDDDWAHLDAREYPEPESDLNGASATVPCPACQARIYEESERCPRCGHYLTEEDDAVRRPWWVTAGLILCLLMALIWAIWG